jgi:hypothetical protein
MIEKVGFNIITLRLVDKAIFKVIFQVIPENSLEFFSNCSFIHRGQLLYILITSERMSPL